MKILFYLIAALCGFCMACNGAKNSVPAAPDLSKLNGTWELNYISGSRMAFDSLYPDKKPTITFDAAQKMVSGNTSCNNFNGPLKAEGASIDFTAPMAMTRMMCMEGNGENIFLGELKKVNTWSVGDDHMLHLMMDDTELMRFAKK